MWRIEEIYDPSKRALQPGWDYVVDTGFDPSKAPIQPANKKRTAGRTTGISGGSNNTAKQDDAIWKRLKELEKDDHHRDTTIAAPRAKNDLGRNKGKTQISRKVLAYQKTFSMWLDQENSEIAAAAMNPAMQRNKPVVHPRRPTARAVEDGVKEEPMDDAPPVVALRPAADGTDDSHLLEVMTPSLPSEVEMERLCSAPPLSYGDAQAGPSSSTQPPLRFCEVCGYWGKIKCIICGTRVCGLSCKQKHDVDCQKYGGR